MSADRVTGPLELLVAVTRIANEAPSVEDAFRRTLEHLGAYTGWSVGHAYLTDPATAELTSAGVWRLPDARALAEFRARTEAMRFAPGVGVIGRVASTKQPAWLEDATLDPDFLRADVAGKVRGGFMVPVLVGDEVVGALECYSDAPAPRDEALLAVLPHVGIQLGRAVERSRARSALAARTDELARAVAELDQMTFAASHDLQEPLRMVAIYTRLLQRRYQGQLDADADRYIDYAVEGAERMSALLTDVLALSRIGSQGRPLVPTDTGAALAKALRGLSAQLEASGGEVLAGSLPLVRGDFAQLELLFAHLVGNALKFRRPDVPPRVHVSAEAEAREWRFAVRDNGVGFEQQFAERIFMLFQRLHGRADYPGTGIGLTICKKIVERHGGRIRAASEPGVGTTIHFTLPRAPG